MKPLLLLLAAAGTTLYLQSRRRRRRQAGVAAPNRAEPLQRSHAVSAFTGVAQSLPRLVDEVRLFPPNGPRSTPGRDRAGLEPARPDFARGA